MEDRIRNGLICIGILLGSGMLMGFLSIGRVGALESALRRNDFSQKIEDKIYGPGTYIIGPFDSFIKFPSQAQTIEFLGENRLSARAGDGIGINIELTFMYQLRRDDLKTLYTTYGTQYESTFISQARSTLRDAAGDFQAVLFFNNRTIIADRMQLALTSDLGEMFADLTRLQVREFDLPDEFENSLKQVQVAQQQVEIAQYEQQAAAVRAQTLIIEAQAAANITLVGATANAEAYLIDMQAQADAMNITLTAQKLAYYAMGQQLNLTSTELLSLLWIMAVMEHDSSYLLIGEFTPLLPIETNTTLP